MTAEDVKKIIKDYFKVKIDEGKGDVDFILQANKDLCTLVEKLENFGTISIEEYMEGEKAREK